MPKIHLLGTPEITRVERLEAILGLIVENAETDGDTVVLMPDHGFDPIGMLKTARELLRDR